MKKYYIWIAIFMGGLIFGILIKDQISPNKLIKADLTFWWSIISTLLGVVLALISVWQFLEAKKEKEKSNSQIKIWMQYANGITTSIKRLFGTISGGHFSGIKDVSSTLYSLEALTFALYQSLYEERCVDEKEYKERQKRIMDKTERDLERQSNISGVE